MELGNWIVASLCLVLAAAAACDAAQRRVPNALSVTVAVLGLASQVAAGGPRAALVAAAVALVLLAVLLFPFSRRMLGGGDVKLLVACATWAGYQRLPLFLLATALAGGVVALGTALVALRSPATVAPPAVVGSGSAPARGRTRLRAVRVPYSIAIAVGAVIALHWRTP